MVELWQELELDRFWGERLSPSRKGTRWDQVLLVLVAYRLIAPGSEWRLHREWFGRTALADLLGADFSLAESHKLYACHDLLLEHKQALFDHLVGRWRDLFNASFEVLLYDLTSTYFESDPPQDEDDKRRFGYSRDKRSDCVQVVIALIVTPQGFPLAYEVLAGNTLDKTTLREFLQKIETQYGKAERIWLMDRGIPTEAVLQEMRHSDPPIKYLVGTPRGRLTRLEKQLVDKPWHSARPGVKVKLLSATRGAVCAGRESRSNRQGALDAPAPTEVAVGTAQATERHDAHARRSPHEAGGGKTARSQRLALNQNRGGQTTSASFTYRLNRARTAYGAATRRALFAAHQSDRERSGQAVELVPPTGGGGRSV